LETWLFTRAKRLQFEDLLEECLKFEVGLLFVVGCVCCELTACDLLWVGKDLNINLTEDD